VKKRVVLLVLFVMLVGIASAQVKLSMELWNRWTYKMIDDTDDAVKNELSLQRGYFSVEPKLTSDIKGRFTLDFFSSDKLSDGAGIKLKYAYLDFANYLWKDATFSFGLMKNYFGTIYDFKYETIDKDPSDKYGFASSTDYGMGISGYLPNGIGEYNLATYNGEGYKKTGSGIDTNMSYLINLRFFPVPGLTIGGSFCLDNKASSYEDGSGNEVDYDETINKMAVVGRITMLPNVDFRAQYLTRTHTNKEWNGNSEEETEKTINAISIMPIIKLSEIINQNMEIVLRYDMYDDDADIDDDDAASKAYDTIIGGVNYYISSKVLVQANYMMKDYKNEEKKDESEIMMQLRWKFSGTIK